MEIRLQGCASLKHGETRVFDVPSKYAGLQGFAIRYGEKFYAYLNQCQHWPIPLDMGDADFYSDIIDRIRCKTHGAVYHPETGECEAGPCGRARLDAFPVTRDGDDLVVVVPDP